MTCKQATEWIIKKEQGKLSAEQQLQILPHLAICSMCRLFETQSALISKAFSVDGKFEGARLTSTEKTALLNSVKEQL